jgi:two-component system, NarL family, nitrate/nitrite response regulator NarL
MILVLVVGPVRVYREGLAHAFARHDDVQVIGTAASAAEALRQIAELGPDVVLVDVSPPDGVEAARALSAAPVKLVALAAPEDDVSVIACVEAGVSGFVAREGSLVDVVSATQAVVRGETACSPEIVAALLRRVATAASPPPSAPLTARERQIVGLIDQGLTNKEIAARLCIELSTVKNHVHNVLEKLGARGRWEAAARMRVDPRIHALD